MSTVWLGERARVLIDAETRKCPRLETGGALFGYESHHELVVACAYGPGPRARHRRTSFEPNPRTTGALIRAVHEASDGRYRYLGSWHSHPNGRARPAPRTSPRRRPSPARPTSRCPDRWCSSRPAGRRAGRSLSTSWVPGAGRNDGHGCCPARWRRSGSRTGGVRK